MNLLRPLSGIVATLLISLLAAAFLVFLWREYMVAPWTRDGRVRAEVVDVASEVSGTVMEIDAQENQLVRKGDVLMRLDPVRFTLALRQAEAELESRQLEQELRKSDVQRRQGLNDLISGEERERTASGVSLAGAAVEAAKAARDVAKLNLDRSVISSPVNGYVTNLRLRVGDYAMAGMPRLSIVDADSFWVAGYFEETKLRGIHLGDPAKIKLMGYDPMLDGHVESVSRGITDINGASDPQGLQNVNPIFTWVRLAQRIPVRVHIDRVPPGIELSSGMTGSVMIGKAARSTPGLFRKLLEE